MVNLLPTGNVLLELGTLGVLAVPLVLHFCPKRDKKQKKFNDFFHNSNLRIKGRKGNYIYPKLIDSKKQGENELYIYSIPNGMAKSQFEAKKEALEHQLKGKVEMWNVNNRLFIKSMTQTLPRKVDFEQVELGNYHLGASIGHSHEGYIINDFSSSGCHLLIAGPTDSGKSVALRQAVLSMLLEYSPQYLKMNLIDLKQGLEMSLFEDMPHVEVIDNIDDTLLILQELNKEINYRGNILKRRELTSIYQANLDSPRIVTVIDEFAELSSDDTIMEQVDRILRLGRASGIHLIVSTQRPTVDVITGNMKNNIQARIALNTPSQIDSKTILDNSMAAQLPPFKGRAIFKKSSRCTEIQIPFVDPKTAKKIMQERLKEIGSKKEEKPAEFQGEMI